MTIKRKIATNITIIHSDSMVQYEKTKFLGKSHASTRGMSGHIYFCYQIAISLTNWDKWPSGYCQSQQDHFTRVNFCLPSL